MCGFKPVEAVRNPQISNTPVATQPAADSRMPKPVSQPAGSDKKVNASGTPKPQNKNPVPVGVHV